MKNSWTCMGALIFLLLAGCTQQLVTQQAPTPVPVDLNGTEWVLQSLHGEALLPPPISRLPSMPHS